MKKTLSIVFCILFFSSITFAQDAPYQALIEASTTVCKKDVQYLSEGQKSPCTGYLFSPAKEYDLRVKIRQYDTLKKLTDRQGELLDTMDARMKNMQEYNEYLSKELKKKENMSFWRSTLYFSLGVVITGAIAANVNR